MTWKKAVFIWEEEKTEVVIVWEVFLFACFFYFGEKQLSNSWEYNQWSGGSCYA